MEEALLFSSSPFVFVFFFFLMLAVTTAEFTDEE